VTDAEERFTSFYEEHRRAVFRTALLLVGDREEAMDLTQEAFARAFQQWGRVASHDRPVAWVIRVVTNLSLSWRRRSRRVGPKVSDATHDPDPPEPAVVGALARLPSAQRAVIVLRFYLDQSVAEVARILGKRPGTVKALTSQALANLKPFLEAKGVKT
jgi:RNA polymerase sigma-70 factor, ECF subfamily